MSFSPYIIIVLLASAVTIYSKYSDQKILLYIFKPLPLLILIILLLISDSGSLYKDFVIYAFIFSLLGDILLMFPKKLFIYGLISFLISHLFFSRAFILGIDNYNVLLLLPVLLFATGNFVILRDSLGKMKAPVFIYLIVISFMLWLGISRWFFYNDTSSLLVLIGSLLFVTSDALLAYNKFKTKFKYAEILILSSYFIAQILFFYSVVSV